MKATWNGAVVAGSDDTLVIEGNHYFPESALKREFVVGSSSLDEQGGLSEMCYLPGQTTPERECWYINMGAVDRSFFTTDAMFRAAQESAKSSVREFMFTSGVDNCGSWYAWVRIWLRK